MNINSWMDAQLKKNVEEICQRMGMNLTTTLTIRCKKIEQERRIPFEVTADPDPFYSESSLRELKRRYNEIMAGTSNLKPQELVKDD